MRLNGVTVVVGELLILIEKAAVSDPIKRNISCKGRASKVSSLNTFFYKFSRSKKMGTIRKEVPIFYLTASGRGSSL